MNPNRYQINIFEVYNTTKKNIFISAGPGSGKTTTILQLLKQTPFYKKSIFLAFNKSISEETKTKVNGKSEVSTIHSLSYKLLRNKINNKLLLNELKTFILAKQALKQELDLKFDQEKKRNAYLFNISRIFDLYRMNLIENNSEGIKKIIEIFGSELSPVEIPNILKVIDYIEKYNSNPTKDNFMIDYTDMLWLTNKFVKVYPKYDVVFIDECQDLNPLQKFIIDNIVSNSGRFIAVGDEKQAIYSFMGSNLDSLNRFKNSPNTVSLPLSVSYRCSKKIIEYANDIFPGMEAFENNKEGEIRYGKSEEIKPGDFVICRNNLPLVEMYIELLGRGLKAKILGRDLGKSLLNIIDSIDDIEDLSTLLEEKRKTLEESGVKNFLNNSQYQQLLEKVEILRSLYYRYQSFKDMSIELNNMFSDKYNENDILLMTGHKSKGLENERVFFLRPDLIPSKYVQTELDFYQEKCLAYVIITRAKNELIFI